MKKSIIILNFGSQYSQLIARRIREMNVYSEVYPYFISSNKIKELSPIGIILSGGPSSVNNLDAFLVTKEIYNFGIPILGICYGMQLIVHDFGGKVAKGKVGEYGKSNLEITRFSSLLANVPKNSIVWMSHFDNIIKIPKNFEVIGVSSSSIAVIHNENKKIYAVQFHPEVSHSEFGNLILKNFVFNICKSKKQWILNNFIENSIDKIGKVVNDKKVILGLSGGVDSSVLSMLIHRAIGNQLICIFIDTGFLRKNEKKEILRLYQHNLKLNVKCIDASNRFINNLIGISDPETKRKQIGKDFIEVFYEEAKKYSNIKFLAQGTIYSDIIESTSIKGFSIIKSHHNVGGLPEVLKLTLLEPLKHLFKDEVKKIGFQLGLSDEILYRHPFPGPGFSIRILGKISRKKIEIIRKADYIFMEELKKNNLYYLVNQAFVVLLPIKSVGIMGDKRTYQYVLAIRSINSVDFMTATCSKLSYEFIEKVSNRIINEVCGINRVVYDFSSKPPATIEWE